MDNTVSLFKSKTSKQAVYGKITENYNMIPAFSFYHKPKIKKDWHLEDRHFL